VDEEELLPVVHVQGHAHEANADDAPRAH
jgi:Icc-related predicted phosphoesterase